MSVDVSFPPALAGPRGGWPEAHCEELPEEGRSMETPLGFQATFANNMGQAIRFVEKNMKNLKTQRYFNWYVNRCASFVSPYFCDVFRCAPCTGVTSCQTSSLAFRHSSSKRSFRRACPWTDETGWGVGGWFPKQQIALFEKAYGTYRIYDIYII